MVDFNDTGIEMMTSIEDHLWPMVEEAGVAIRENEIMMGNYASSIEKLMTCMLRCYFDRVDKIEEDFSHLTNTFAHGNSIHEMIIDMFKKAGIWRGDEVRGSNKQFNISYRIDALISDPTNGGEIVPVEIKSVKASSWAMTKNEPFLSHYLQLQIYIHFIRPNQIFN